MAMEMKALQEYNLESITNNYLERGHTQMSVDSMHSAIENSAKNVSIYSPNDWCNIMRMARRKHPYKVIRLKFEDFIDLKKLHTDTMVNFSKDSDGNKFQ